MIGPSRLQVLESIAGILRREFLDPALAVSGETTADDVPGWDSLSHARLLVRLEEHFGIRFVGLEGESPPNVGALADLICGKLEGQVFASGAGRPSP